tara:strand:+ start:1340 stop:2173 length:834 start_codon:yes stop_codon:yes gene_type:complete
MKLLYPLAKRFIAGHDFDSAKPKIKELMDQGYEVSIDYLGETSSCQADCNKARSQYFKIINYYRDQKIDISIKPSQLGIKIHPILSYTNLSVLARHAKNYGHTIRLDMEDSSVTQMTINQALSLNKKFGNVGVAIQANLYRSKEDLQLLKKNNVSVRIVKGAYRENSLIAYQDAGDIEHAFFHHAANMVHANKTAIGTHDEELLLDISDMLLHSNNFDYEFLYGIRRDLHKMLKDEGKKVRIYVPFGHQWLPYTLRRLREFKNLKFVLKNIWKEWIT